MAEFDKSKTPFTDTPWWKSLPTPISVSTIKQNRLKAFDHGFVPEPLYLIAQNMGYLEGKINTCGFCKWAFEHTVLAASDPDSDIRPVYEFTIWITGAGQNDHTTGLPTDFRVYVRNTVRNSGHAATWKGCYDHAYMAYLDYQQIMLDELHDWEMTNRWMQTRNGRI